MSNDSSQADHSPSSLCPWHWGWSAALALIVLITLAFRYALPVRDGDLWFHMLYGKYFLENGTLIADHTIFSWTPTTNDTIYVTWLPDIFLYLLHKAAGLPGIFAFRYLCMLVPVLGCFLYARKLKITSHPLTWFFCLLAVIMSYTAAFEKPEILSFVFMTLVAWNWWHIRSSGEEAWKNCYLFPVIMLIWVNTHGGFVFGAVFLFLIWLGELLNTWLSPQNTLSPKVRKHLTIALFIAAFTPLLNPYGYHYPLQLFTDLLPTEANTNFNKKIAAYSATFLGEDVYNLTISADLAIILLLTLFWRNFKKIDWSVLLANFVFAYLYTKFYRATFFWVPVFLFSALNLLASCPIIPPSWQKNKLLNRLLPILLLASTICLAANILYKAACIPEKYLWMGFGISESNPVDEAQYIKKYFPQNRLGNTYDQGAYLLWELWPENKVFFDARHFPYRKWSDDFFLFSQGIKVEKFVEKYPCDLWCVSLEHTATYLWFALSPEWKLAYYGKSAAIFLRQDIPLPSNTPRASPALSTQKSPSSAVTTLTFALNIHDWSAVDQILTHMRQEFNFFSQKEMVRKATIFAQGIRAYYRHDYEKTVKLFDSIYPDVMISNITYAYSLIHLSAIVWEKGDGVQARKLNKRTWLLYPGYYMNIYNAGAMNWFEKIDPDLWKFQLKEFLARAPNTLKTQLYRENAQKMLDNTFTGRPALMTPSPP
ncbi:MAG TPA: hypothetical protein DEQ20_05980 [Desulfobulbaceae bacterium]|nr:MAG: hypothetical protein A2520_06955 [Deltaproteobacteria bacterium RIFOXYD12_FULL_53_23]HCC54458.1 hypothetical protein [Desulfobulbaceae bacterium]